MRTASKLETSVVETRGLQVNKKIARSNSSGGFAFILSFDSPAAGIVARFDRARILARTRDRHTGRYGGDRCQIARGEPARAGACDSGRAGRARNLEFAGFIYAASKE